MNLTSESEFITKEFSNISEIDLSENLNYTSYSHCYSDSTINPLYAFLVGGIAIMFLSLIGIIGNILSIIVLTRPVMRSSTNIILLGLSVCDLVYVTVTLILHGEEVFDYLCTWPEFSAIFLPIVLGFLLPILFIAQFGSVYFTVCVTVERFVVVFRPLQARSYCTVNMAIWISLIIVTLAVLFTLPTWWEYSYEENYDGNGVWIGYKSTTTELFENPDYVIYYTAWSWFIVFRAIPLVLLTALNLIIYKKVREANKMRKTMSQSESNEFSVAKMLICIVTIFLICNFLQIYLSMNTAFITGEGGSSDLSTFSGLMLNLNSSINFIIYCLMGKKFRRTCAQLLGCGKLRQYGAKSTISGLTILSATGSINKDAYPMNLIKYN